MNNLPLPVQLAELAWLARAESAAADLRHAAEAPALFKREFVAQREADYVKAVQQTSQWSVTA